MIKIHRKTARCVAAIMILCLLMMTLSGFTYNSDKQRVFDNYGFLTADEYQQMEQLCKQYSVSDEADYVIVSTDKMDGKSSMEYADDFFDYNGFGYEKEMGSGLLLLVNMEDREVYISTSGKCIEQITDAEVDQALDAIIFYIQDQQYYTAYEEFLIQMSSKMSNSETKSSVQTNAPNDSYPTYPDGSRYPDGSSYNGSGISSYLRTIKANLVMFLIIAVVLALIVTGFMVRSAKSRMTVNSRTYMIKRDDNPGGTSDSFIRTHVTKIPIPKKDNTSGGLGGFIGGGIHIGSSGNSHGGGGRSF